MAPEIGRASARGDRLEHRLVDRARSGLGRPIGLSGSGPTMWTLYPSLGEAEAAAKTVEDAIGSGAVPSIGDGPPTVIATTIRTGHDPATHQGEAT